MFDVYHKACDILLEGSIDFMDKDIEIQIFT